jgi:hypothetical protein
MRLPWPNFWMPKPDSDGSRAEPDQIQPINLKSLWRF